MIRKPLVIICLLAAPNSLVAAAPDWLIGCWQSQAGDAIEVWVQDETASLIGFGVAFSERGVEFFETLTVKETGTGEVTYEAYPYGQSSTSFIARDVSKAANLIKFTNAQHDYPQVISYRRDGDKLHASISMIDGRERQSFEKHACSRTKLKP